MNAVENNAPPTNVQSARRSWFRRVRLRYAIIALPLLLVGHLLLGSYAGYRHRHTCVICRLERIDYAWENWSPTSTYNETSCSKWYRSHVEESHDHVWSPGPTIALLNFYGQTIGVGDNLDHPGRAVWALTPDQQISIYEHFPNQSDAKRLFISLTDSFVMDNRADYLIAYSLRDWLESGFIGQWHNPNAVADPPPG